MNPKTGQTKFTDSYSVFETYVQELNAYNASPSLGACRLSSSGMKAAVLGSPIAHSLSPVLHRAAYRALGLTGWSYQAIECDEAGLPALLAGCGPQWAGLSLTMPLKRAVLPLLDATEPAGPRGRRRQHRRVRRRPAPWAQHRRARHDRRPGRGRHHRGAARRC